MRWPAAVLFLAALLLAACEAQPRRATPAQAPPAAALPAAVTADPTPAATSYVDVRRRERDEALERLDVAERRLAAAIAARDEARRDRLRLIALWVSGFAVLGVLASAALWFVLPVGVRRWAAAGGSASLAVLVAGAALSAIIPYLAAIAAVLVVGGVAWGLWHLARTTRAAREAAEHADRLELACRDWYCGDPEQLEAMLEAVKAVSSEQQADAGVQRLLAAIRGKLRKPPAPAPEAA